VTAVRMGSSQNLFQKRNAKQHRGNAEMGFRSGRNPSLNDWDYVGKVLANNKILGLQKVPLL
jgi:hypothetical protein